MYELLIMSAVILGVAFASNVSPFFGASYTFLATLDLILMGFTPANFLLVVVFSAVGAALGKVAIYFGAFGLRRFLVGNRNIQLIGRNASKRTFYGVLFVAAFLPVLPLDDFIYIGAGANSASLGAMGGVTLAAKLLKSTVEVGLEFSVLREVIGAFTFSNIYLAVLLTAAFMVLGVVIYQLDWAALMRRYLHVDLDGEQREKGGSAQTI